MTPSPTIKDKEGHDLDLAAKYSMAKVKQAETRAAGLQEEADAAIKANNMAPEAYDAAFAARAARTEADAANWQNYQHYRDNKDAYYDAAKQEDAARANALEHAQSAQEGHDSPDQNQPNGNAA